MADIEREEAHRLLAQEARELAGQMSDPYAKKQMAAADSRKLSEHRRREYI
jgi:hypothetical protein